MTSPYSRSYRAQHYGSHRGATRGNSRAFPSPRLPRKIPAVLGPLLGTLKVNDKTLEMCVSSQAKITMLKVMATYNLMGKGSATIMVPGAPPLYTPLSRPMRLDDDALSGNEYHRDENAARFPDYPMEPTVKSLFMSRPMFDTSTVDVFTCGSTMGNLVRFVQSNSQAFSFVVHIVGNTAFFLRREQSPTELIEGVVGYGHAFPEAYTTWQSDVKRSSSHQRVISYSFGGLSFLIRFEGDGYIQDKNPHASSSMARTDSTPVEDLLSDLLTEDTATAGGINDVERRGHHVEQSDVFDLKTRSIRKVDEDIIAEELPRLWVRQIPRFILAFHRSGLFEDIRVEDVRARVLEWETRSALPLSKLAGLVRKIIDTAAQQPNAKIEVRGTEEGTLTFHTVDQSGWNALPPYLAARWRSSQSGHSPDEDESNAEVRQTPTDGPHSGSHFLSERYDSQLAQEGYESDEGPEDFTACSAEDCGYCGRCSY